MMPLGLFRSPVFSGINLLTLLLYFALGGAMFFLPFDLIRVHGWSATRAGAAMLPFAAVMGLFSGVGGTAGRPVRRPAVAQRRPDPRRGRSGPAGA